jgi:hypothetical protein
MSPRLGAALGCAFAVHGGDDLRFGAGTDRENTAGPGTRCQIGVAHAAVEIDGIALVQDHGRIEFGVKFHRAFEDVGVFFTRVAHQFAEFLERALVQFRDDRHEALVEHFRRRIDVAVVLRLDLMAFTGAGDAAPSRGLATSGDRRARAEKLGDVDFETGA